MGITGKGLGVNSPQHLVPLKPSTAKWPEGRNGYHSKNIYLFFKNVFTCLFLAVLALHCCSGFFSSCSEELFPAVVRAPHCGGFSCGVKAPGVVGSVAVARGLSSCGAEAQFFCSMWYLPISGLETVSPAMAVGFFITEPPGKPARIFRERNRPSILSQMMIPFSSLGWKKKLATVLAAEKPQPWGTV